MINTGQRHKCKPKWDFESFFCKLKDGIAYHTLRDGNKTCKSVNRPCDGVDRIILLTYRVNRHDLDTGTRASATWPTEFQIE